MNESGGRPSGSPVRRDDGQQCRLSDMRRFGLIVLASVVLGACSSIPNTGTVEGHFQVVGGPCCGEPRPLPGKIEFIASNGARTIVKVAADGVFQIHLAPGTYTAVGHSPRVHSDGFEMACDALKPVIVRTGRSGQPLWIARRCSGGCLRTDRRHRGQGVNVRS